MKNKNNMKILMENFNKFLKEGKTPEEAAIVDRIIDGILDDMPEEGALNEYGVGDEYDHLRNLPSKEEAKEAIQKTLDTPEIQSEIEKIDKEVEAAMVPAPGAKEYGAAAGSMIKDLFDPERLAILAVSLGSAPVFGAVFGGMMFGPGEGGQADTYYHYNPEAYDAAVRAGDKAFQIGGSVGLAISAVIAAYLVRETYTELKRRASSKAAAAGKFKDS